MIGWATRNWADFDTWCLLQGIEPLELSSQRFVNLVLYCLREGLTDEGLEKMNQTIEAAGRVPHPWLAPVAPVKTGPAPPPGWRSDEDNWRGIQGFLGQMSTVKGAVSREKVKPGG